MGIESEHYFTHRHHPLSGVPSKKGPEPGFRNQAENQRSMSVTSKLGYYCERGLTKVWSGAIVLEPENDVLKSTIERTVAELAPIRTRTFRKHGELAEFYQALTRPAEIPFLGDERTWPDFEPLAILFREVDQIYDINLQNMFQELGEACPQSGTIEPSIRYLVETALILGKLATQPPPSFGKIVPNVAFRNGDNGKLLAQFDAIFVPEEHSENPREIFVNPSHEMKRVPWTVMQVKVPLRARFVSGRMKKPFPRNIAEFQDQLGRIIIHQERKTFHFPNLLILAYLRGTRPHIIHRVPLDYSFFERWRRIFELKIESGFFHYENPEHIEKLSHILQVAEKRAFKREEKRRRRRKRERTKLKNGPLVQSNFPQLLQTEEAASMA